MLKVKKAVIPAAGLGTRFLPITKAVPKPMLPVLDKPTVQYIAEELSSIGIEEIIIDIYYLTISCMYIFSIICNVTVTS